MKILWAHGPSTVADVREHLEDKLDYTTVSTVLRTLEDKTHVDHKKEGKAHRYHVAVAENAARQMALTLLVDRLFGGSAELLLSHLVADCNLSATEVNRLRALMDISLPVCLGADAIGEIVGGVAAAQAVSAGRESTAFQRSDCRTR